MNRKNRVKIAEETLKILDEGKYVNLLGELVQIRESLKQAIESSTWYEPDALPVLLEEAQREQSASKNTIITVHNMTTFEGCKLLLEDYANVVCLNFASAKNPGGGFLGGSQAQEEALARASGLYPCLVKHMDMYLKNRQEKKLYYSHDMIYSRLIPVFRDDNDQLLNSPYQVSVITSAAVNAGYVLKHRPDAHHEIRQTLEARARYVLSIALHHQYDGIVLGAWGCGVFRNDPDIVADIFYRLLNTEFKNCFKHVLFAVLDNSSNQATYSAFKKRLLQ